MADLTGFHIPCTQSKGQQHRKVSYSQEGRLRGYDLVNLSELYPVAFSVLWINFPIYQVLGVKENEVIPSVLVMEVIAWLLQLRVFQLPPLGFHLGQLNPSV